MSTWCFDEYLLTFVNERASYGVFIATKCNLTGSPDLRTTCHSATTLTGVALCARG